MVHKIIWLLLLLPAEEWKLSFLQTYMHTSPNASSKYFVNSTRLISWQRTKPQQCSVLLSNYCYTEVVEYKKIKTAEINVVLTFQISKGELIKCIRWLSNYHFLHDFKARNLLLYLNFPLVVRRQNEVEIVRAANLTNNRCIISRVVYSRKATAMWLLGTFYLAVILDNIDWEWPLIFWLKVNELHDRRCQCGISELFGKELPGKLGLH